MIYLCLAILCSSLINLIFKKFGRFKIHTLTAIVFNYITCSLLGQALGWQWVFGLENTQQPYFLFALVLGIVFIAIFFCMAKTTEIFGVGVNSVSAKMGFIFPTVFFMVYLNESLQALQWIAISIALVSILLIVPRGKQNSSIKLYHILFPVLVFIGSGIIDSAIKWMDLFHNSSDSPLMASTSIFSSAALIGIGILVFNPRYINLKNIVAGIILGVPNLFSIYFLIMAINKLENWSTGLFFASNNMGVILLSTLAAVFLMGEKLSKKQAIGLSLSLISIFIISFAI
jgi:drug/metabolite transporter (DMT)-like permease